MSIDEKNVRHRFTVPTADTKVNDWIKSQSNLGFSLRVLIKAFVKDYGYQDATCLELGTEAKRRGRPPKALKAQIDTVYDEYEDTNIENETEKAIHTRQTPVITETNHIASPVQQPMVQPVIQSIPQPVQYAQPVKPVVQTPVAASIATQPTASNDDLINMMSGMTIAQPAPIADDNTTAATTDDDGFVDPESLF